VKAQCERCKEIVPLEFTVAVGGIEVTCGSCGATYRVDARPAEVVESPEPAPAPAPPGAMVCPKCGDAQPAAEACRRCGLIQSRWRGPESAADGTDLDLVGARDAAALWELCLQKWEDPAPHDAFLAHCQAAGTFALAASRYRAALVLRSERDPVAASRLKQVRSLAEQALTVPGRATAPTHQTKTSSLAPYKNVVVLLTLVLALLLGAVVYLLVRG
jgi:hypothetical protein